MRDRSTYVGVNATLHQTLDEKFGHNSLKKRIEKEAVSHIKLLLWGHSLGGSVVHSHGMSGQTMVLFKLGIE